MNIEEEISEFVQDPIQRQEEDSVEEPKKGDGKRGAKKLPDMWSRVISIGTDNLEDLKVFPLATDLLLKEGYQKGRKRKGEPDWECHFSPKQYLEMHPNPELEKMKITEDRLRRYGE